MLRRLLSTTAAAADRFRGELVACRSLGEIERLVKQSPLSVLQTSSAACASAINLLGRLKSKDTEAVQRVLSTAAAPLRFTPSELVLVCTGIAMGRLAPQIPSSVVDQLLLSNGDITLKAMDAKQMVWTLGSFAVLDQLDAGRRLCDLVRREVVHHRPEIVKSFTGNEFALIMHYFDKFSFVDANDTVLQSFSREISAREPTLADFKPGHLALLLDAVAKSAAANGGNADDASQGSTPLYVYALCKRVGREICFDRRRGGRGGGGLAEFDARDIGMILNCFAEFNIRDRAVCETLSEEILRRTADDGAGLDAFTRQDIGRILGSLDHLEFVNPVVVERLMMEVMRREEEEEKQHKKKKGAANAAAGGEVVEDEDDKEEREEAVLRRMARTMRRRDANDKKKKDE